MTELVSNPPKYELEDGTVQTWRGMPKLPDVVGVMMENRHKGFLKRQRDLNRKQTLEMKQWEERRQAHPEEFFSIQDAIKEFLANHKQKAVLKEIPSAEEPVSPVLLGLDGGARERELAEQAEQLKKQFGATDEQIRNDGKTV